MKKVQDFYQGYAAFLKEDFQKIVNEGLEKHVEEFMTDLGTYGKISGRENGIFIVSIEDGDYDGDPTLEYFADLLANEVFTKYAKFKVVREKFDGTLEETKVYKGKSNDIKENNETDLIKPVQEADKLGAPTKEGEPIEGTVGDAEPAAEVKEEPAKKDKKVVDLSKEKVDTRPLFKFIEKLCGFKPKGLTFKVEKATQSHATGKFWTRLTSDNLLDKAGIFALCVKEIKLTNFGGEAYMAKDEKNPDADGTMRLWMPVVLSYTHLGGGTNSATIFTAWYEYEKKEWKFKMEGSNEIIEG